MHFHFVTAKSFFLFLFLTALQGCSKKEDPITESETGTIAGTLLRYDDKTNQYADASGISVSIIGMPDKQTTTAPDGRFKLEKIPFGNHDLVFSKLGYGTYKIFGIEHFRQSNTVSGTPSTTTLKRVISFGSISNTTVEQLLPAVVNDNNFIGIAFSYSVKPQPTSSNRAYTRSFVGKKNDFTPLEALGYSGLKGALSNNVIGSFSVEELYGFGLNKGDSVYVKVYGDSFYSNDYTDPISGNTLFPNLNPVAPPAIGFIVP